MKRTSLVLGVLFVFGCAKVQVETKDPIKVNIKMRIDVYQHVLKDVESINDQIYSNSEHNFNLLFNFGNAYAADLSPEAQAAISRRKERAPQIKDYFQKGYLGENRNALLETRPNAPSDAAELVSQENKDRQIIYKATAEKNGTSVSEVEKVFYQDDFRRAPQGWWFEVQRSGVWNWEKK